MYTIDELTKKEKDMKKAVRELGGLAELFPDVKENYDEQISIVKKLVKANKTYEENKNARFGKGAKLKKESSAEISELEERLDEAVRAQTEKDEKIKLFPTISKERTAELAAMTAELKTEEIKKLEFEELATCLSAGMAKLNELKAAEQKNDILIEKHNIQQKELHKEFIEKLKAVENYYISFSPATRAPYMDLREKTGQACMWLFTKEEYAKNCRNFFARRYIFTDIVKVTKEEFTQFSKNLPRMGFNAFTLNNGVHNLTVELAALTGKIQYTCPINPSLHARRLDFFQSLLLFNKVPQTNHKLYEQYHNPVIMKAKESVMLHELYKAKYTLVMKIIKQKNEKGEEVEASEIPTNMKDDTRFLLVFTDMLEFNNWKKASGFKTDEPGFVAKAVDFATVDKMASDTNSELLIDRNGWCFEFTKARRDAAKKIAEQVAKLEEQKKKEQGNKK